MCFTERHSYFNAVLLLIGGYIVKDNIRLTLPLLFLAFKDILQGLLYRGHNKKLWSTLSWVHICFQPLFVNLFISHFDHENIIWKYVFLICGLWGIYMMTTIEELDIQNNPNCNLKQDTDFCAKETSAYMGKHHIAYLFNRDDIPFTYSYRALMFLPLLFTKARFLYILWGLFAYISYYFFNDIRSGERSAIFCLSSIVYFLPIAIFNKNISGLI